MARPRKSGARRAHLPETVMQPTLERLRHAGQDFVRGDTGTVTMLGVLERLHQRGVLGDTGSRVAASRYDAAIKYRNHWTRGGLQERFSAVKMDGVFGGEGVRGLPTSEMALHHREQYRVAVQDVGAQLSLVIEDICCRDVEPVEVGKKLGWPSPPQARAAAVELLKTGLDRLARLWGYA